MPSCSDSICIFNCVLGFVLYLGISAILKGFKAKNDKILDDELNENDPSNSFQRIYHERKPGYINLKIAVSEEGERRSVSWRKLKLVVQDVDDLKISQE